MRQFSWKMIAVAWYDIEEISSRSNKRDRRGKGRYPHSNGRGSLHMICPEAQLYLADGFGDGD